MPEIFSQHLSKCLLISGTTNMEHTLPPIYSLDSMILINQFTRGSPDVNQCT